MALKTVGGKVNNVIRTVSSSTRIGHRAIRFCIVGGVGALIQLGLTYSLTELLGLYYMISLVIAIGAATTWNFLMQGSWVFGAFKLKRRVL